MQQSAYSIGPKIGIDFRADAVVISAVVLAALISAKEAKAFGIGGFARGFASSSAIQIATASVAAEKDDAAVALTFANRRELLRVNSAVERTIADVDGYLDSIAGGFSLDQGFNSCVDCADLKREQLISLGWSEKAMRIAYSVTNEGRVERVLVISTDRGDVVLGKGGPAVDMCGERLPASAEKSASAAAPAFIDI